MSTWLIVVISAATGALVSGVFQIISRLIQGRHERAARLTEIAVRLLETRQRQIEACQEWNLKAGAQPRQVELWDPAESLLVYRRGVEKIEKGCSKTELEATIKEAKAQRTLTSGR